MGLTFAEDFDVSFSFLNLSLSAKNFVTQSEQQVKLYVCKLSLQNVRLIKIRVEGKGIEENSTQRSVAKKRNKGNRLKEDFGCLPRSKSSERTFVSL